LKINDAEKITGLSKKAIRLYEERGLLQIQRISNGYRDYTDTDIELLKKIKLLRLAGISISHIKLWRDGVITIEDLLAKRKSELEEESGTLSNEAHFCDTILHQFQIGGLDTGTLLEENEGFSLPESGELSVGIDIGTTTISAAVMDLTHKKQIEAYTVPNSFKIPSLHPNFEEQDAEGITQKALDLLKHIQNSFSNIRSIGITGQMHGILYLNEKGESVSPLMTWQDKRGEILLDDGSTICEQIEALTGETVLTGYGLATHCYNVMHGLVPEDAVTFCSIMDYLAMKLTGRRTPLIHPSVAASFGLFDRKAAAFRTDKIASLPMGGIGLPEITGASDLCGEYMGIPVSAAIGDNQASYLGSVKHAEDSILINIGTGSQISMISDDCTETADVEIRPWIKGKFLLCGSALCGGSAYALLEKFFRAYAVSCGLPDVPQYDIMNRMAKEAYEEKKPIPHIDTTFDGTRSAPARRGEISEIHRGNFTPRALTLGFIHGICRELYDLIPKEKMQKKTEIVASGGGVQRNEVIPAVLADLFELPVFRSRAKEEAAVGAALFSALNAGLLKSMNDFSDFIQY